MNKDFRVAVNYADHFKIVQLGKRLGLEAVICHLRLLGYVAQYKPKGILHKMTDADIESAAGWKGELGLFVATLADLKLVDIKTKRGIRTVIVHDWFEYNSYAFYGPERAKKAQDAANARWRKRLEQCSEHNLALPLADSSNAPPPPPPPPPSPEPKVKVKGNPPTPLLEKPGADSKPSPHPRSDFSNREPKGSELPLPPAPVLEPDSSDRKQAQGPQKLKVHIASLIKTAFANKFKGNLPDDEVIRLLNGNERFPGFQKPEILLFAISKISDKMANPIGALIDFSRNPEKYLSKADDYDQWKRLQRGMKTFPP